jgi:predicted CXXCH cytochrome family protein
MKIKLLQTMRRRASRPRAFLARAGAGLAVLLAAASAPAEGILGSKHDLSVGGPGPVKAATETEVCIFCHTPHRASPAVPLWNHALSSAVYTPYNSSTLKARVGQPTGSSKLCLSCHDGTVALGMVGSRSTPITMAGGAVNMPIGPSNLGTDLSDDHPISFTYDAALAAANGQLRDPSLLTDRVRVDHNKQVQCTSCHDAHNNRYSKFLVQDNYGSALCLNCHAPPFWLSSAHRNSSQTWNGAGLNPWPHTDRKSVAANGCENCHAPHAAGTPQRLLTFAMEEDNCSSCHSGNVATKDIYRELTKASAHPVLRNSKVHDPAENPMNAPRHAECADCHNPHAANASLASPPNVPGPLIGVIGVSSSGGVVDKATREYELCFRCHADSSGKGPAAVPRQYPETNTRLEFASANASFHPVEARGKNSSMPSLLPPYTSGSLIYCTSCHNNDQGPGANGSGPKGPHGSIYSPLLERPLTIADYNPENANTYALCYKCHNQAVVTGQDDTSWTHHKKHVVDCQAACTTCHDPHGVVSKPHLINFNTGYVQPSSSGRLEYISTGANRGSCYLSCHDKNGQLKDHNPKSY